MSLRRRLRARARARPVAPGPPLPGRTWCTLHDPHAAAAGAAGSGPRPRALSPSRRVDFALRGALSRWKYRACRRVIAVSRGGGARARSGTACPRRPCAWCTRACPTARPPAGRPRTRCAALGVPAGAPVVGNVAALTGAQGPRDAAGGGGARVAARARGAVRDRGRGRAARPAARRRRRRSGLEDRVVFAGFRADLDRLAPGLRRLLPLVAHGGARHQPARRDVLRAAGGGDRGRRHPGGGGGRRDRPRGAAAPGRGAGRRPHRRCSTTARRARRWARPGARRFHERFTADRMVDETLAVYAEAA